MARLGHAHQGLLSAVAAHASSNMADYQPQSIANLVWYDYSSCILMSFFTAFLPGAQDSVASCPPNPDNPLVYWSGC